MFRTILPAILCLILLSPPARSQETPRPRTEQELRQKLRDVEQRMKDLQRELDQLRQRSAPTTRPFNFRFFDLPRPVLPQMPQPTPPDWQRREFNGQPYYLIPLK